MKIKTFYFSFFIFLSFMLASCHNEYYNFQSSRGAFKHKVQKGETVSLIAQKYKTTIAEIIDVNDLDPPYLIFIGQDLLIPKSAKIHIVNKGETLIAIAKKYNISYRKIASYNKIQAPFHIHPGQKLQLFLSPHKIDNDQGSFMTATARVQASEKALRTPPPRSGKFRWPAQGKIIVPYGNLGGGKKSEGINIALNTGMPIRASDDGVVAYSGDDLQSFGEMILINHEGGWITTYAHSQKRLVKRGETVKKGQIIAYAGMTGHVKQPQLFFQIRKKKVIFDPLKYLQQN